MAWKARHWWGIGAASAVLALVVVLALTFSSPPLKTPAATSVSTAPTPGPASATRTSSPATPSRPRGTATPGTTPAAPPPGSATQAPPSNAPTTDLARQKLASMTLGQRVGQAFMVSSPVTGADAQSVHVLADLHVGNVFLKGRSTAGVDAIAAVVADAAGHALENGVRPFVATDQEGGFVQIMRGPGFDTMPQAIEQGLLAPATLQADAKRWGQQLATAGVNVNLAPVLDTVPGAAFAPRNAPIGAFGREYGYTPAAVSSHGLAFARGMLAAGVEPAVKHFPGLGRVTGNTDVTAGVTDSVTVRNDPYVAPFRDAVNAGVPWLMVSNAYYPKIDTQDLGPFSHVIIQGMVRGDLGFKGIIVSDDICDARQVAAVPAAQRGVDFINAGGTMVLCTNQSVAPTMYQGMVAAAQSNPAFARRIDAAALLVLEAKAAKGLIAG
ncbi:glycoside hydrolase family 3 N-terminal domain-containing protein [Arthrobacter dokdonensis]|uniref:glycoside hydrolase family 3 N-terminal domain-containing protein n=1 Tax=Arthrobacter dokdonellae TaxID=2211210 RepID=UPI001D131C2D|nr:glycoside hydrolase family 3 N-terminal domain-containing protein [Arthrobacter dokdonellae]